MRKQGVNTNGIIHEIHEVLWKIKVILIELIDRIIYFDVLKKNKKYKNLYKGQTCIVIGNGPSLTIDDLNRIHDAGIITFGSNRVFNLFGDTNWRPNYYVICDTKLFHNERDKIDKIQSVIFYPLDIAKKCRIKGANVFSRVPFQLIKKYPSFSSNLCFRLCEGGTVTYHMLQIAAYMGFTSIYLLGVDFSFSWGIDVNGNYFEDPSKKDHFSQYGKKTDTMPNLQYNHRAYESALKYCNSKGTKIIDLTRKGALDVFEKGDIDELFSQINMRKG